MFQSVHSSDFTIFILICSTNCRLFHNFRTALDPLSISHGNINYYWYSDSGGSGTKLFYKDGFDSIVGVSFT